MGKSAFDTPLIELRRVSKVFKSQKYGKNSSEKVVAVDDVSLIVNSGETLGIVGETGSGKSTLGRIMLGLDAPTSGSLIIEGQEINSHRERMSIGRDHSFQMVFQDPAGSLNPQMSVRQLLLEAIICQKQSLDKREQHKRLLEALNEVELSEIFLSRYPAQLSGGQQQRVANARALLTNPKLLLLDEAVSALDALTQSNLLKLLKVLQAKHDLTYIFISHDLEAVAEISTRTAVMYQGKIIEIGESSQIFNKPQHPYTRGLRKSVPIRNPRHARRQRSIFVDNFTNATELNELACCFIDRCPILDRVLCINEAPILTKIPGNGDHVVACHYYDKFNERLNKLQEEEIV